MLRQKLLFSHPVSGPLTTLYSWGASASYATGQNTTSTITTPTAVGGANKWLKVVSFGGNTVGYGGFAIKSDGTLWSWGDSSNYGTGQNTLINIQVPTKVGTASNWVDVAGFGGGGFAIKSDGTLWSWGESSLYQTGQNTTTNIQVPTQVGVATNWSKVSAFSQGGYAIKTDGTLWSWGYSGSYATGQSTTTAIQVPTQIGTDTNWVKVVGGGYTGFALKSNRTLYSWGSSNNYATGQNTTTNIQLPTQVGTATNWIDVAASSYTGYGVQADGTLWSWGNSANYATGQATLTNIQVPTKVGSATNWTAVFGGFTSLTGYARNSANDCYSWGYSADYEGGNGGTASITSPNIIIGANGWSSFSCSTSAFAINGLTLPTFGSLYSWGNNLNGGTAQNVATGNTLTPTLAVDSHTNWSMIVTRRGYGTTTASSDGTVVFGLQSNGTLWGWGANNLLGQPGTLGLGNNANVYLVPTQIGTDTNWSYVVATYNGGLAIKTNGTLWSWGTDTRGALGMGGSSAVAYTPTQVGVRTDWVKVFCGEDFTFLIDTAGKLWTIGSNDGYTTGLNLVSGDTTTITQVGTATNWSYVTCGPNGQGAIGLRTDGTIWSWGSDTAGELGQGSGAVIHTPTQIGVATTWAKVFMGRRVSFLIDTSNKLWVLGSNIDYQTGLGTSSGSNTTPTQVGTSNWSAICPVNNIPGGVAYATIGLQTNGTLWSWGNNNDGQTGQGTTSGFTTSPTQLGTVSTWNLLATPCGGLANLCFATHT